MSRSALPAQLAVELLSELALKYPEVADLQSSLAEATSLASVNANRVDDLVELVRTTAAAPSLVPKDRKRLFTLVACLLRDAAAFERTCATVLTKSER